MASHKNGNVPENSQNMPGQGLHIHVATETANAWMPKPQWACTGHMTLLCCRGTEAKASFITLLFFKAISFSIHGARHEAMSTPSDRVQPSLQRMFGLCKVCLCPSTPKTHSGQVPSGPLRSLALGTLAVGTTTHPGHQGGFQFNYLPRAPGDQRTVAATWSRHAY